MRALLLAAMAIFLLTVKGAESLKKYFKYEQDSLNFDDVTPQLRIVFNDMVEYCRKNNQEFLVTSFLSTLTEDESLMRESASHREGRAFDVSIKNWNDAQVENFITYYCNESPLKTLGAYSLSDKKQRLVARHNSGFGDHIHVQVHP